MQPPSPQVRLRVWGERCTHVGERCAHVGERCARVGEQGEVGVLLLPSMQLGNVDHTLPGTARRHAFSPVCCISWHCDHCVCSRQSPCHSTQCAEVAACGVLMLLTGVPGKCMPFIYGLPRSKCARCRDLLCTCACALVCSCLWRPWQGRSFAVKSDPRRTAVIYKPERPRSAVPTQHRYLAHRVSWSLS